MLLFLGASFLLEPRQDPRWKLGRGGLWLGALCAWMATTWFPWNALCDLHPLIDRLAQTLQEQRKYIRLGKKPEDVAQALCKLALSVRSKLTVLPVQDILGLDNSARMNHPSTEQGNWRFRLERRPRRGVMRRLKHWIKLHRR